MSIVVRCLSCQASYNVKDEYAGRQFNCRTPGCNTVLSVPGTKSEMAPQPSTAPVIPQIDAPAMQSVTATEPPICVMCPICTEQLSVPANQAGQKVRCTSCGQKLQVPLRQAAATPVPTNKTVLAPLVDAPDAAESAAVILLSPTEGTPHRAGLSVKQKTIAGIVGGAILFLSALTCCSGITWFVATDFGAKRELERTAAEEKAIQKAREAVAKVFSEPAKKKRPPISNWLTPDKAAIVDGIKVELVEGHIAKLRIRIGFRDVSRLSDQAYCQIGIRITNQKENFVLEYSPWGYGRNLHLLDEFGNRYKQYYDH